MTKINKKNCALICLGNININLKLKHTLEGTFQTLIAQQFENFLLRENNTFDALCYNILQNSKSKYPQIKLIKCTSFAKKFYDDFLPIQTNGLNNKIEDLYFLINNANFVVFSSITKNNNTLLNLINYCKQNQKAYLVL